MAKYRKKPVIVEAVQWKRDNFPMGDYWQGTDSTGVEWTVMEKRIRTLEGFHRIMDGDWIITGVEGEKYNCRDSIFQKTYERVEDDFNGL
jgi:hypothetical protein